MRLKYHREMLQEAVEGSTCVADVIRKLGLKPSGGNFSYVRKRIEKYGIDISHFKQHTDFLQPGVNKRSAEEILVLREGGTREKAARLRRAMIESGIEYKCVACGISDVYNGMSLVLEVNHKSGDWLDNRIANLEFRCPNCHSQYGRVMKWQTCGA